MLRRNMQGGMSRFAAMADSIKGTCMQITQNTLGGESAASVIAPVLVNRLAHHVLDKKDPFKRRVRKSA